MNNISAENKILLYDGNCNLCDGIYKFLSGLDKSGKFQFYSLQSVNSEKLVHQLKLDKISHDAFIYIRNGIVYFKSTASLYVLKDIGGLWKFFYLLIIIPTPVRDFFYDLLAKNRYKIFGRTDTCSITPT